MPLVAHPAGIPGTYDEHAKLLIDLQVLAYQCDLTRIITLMMGREFSGMTYPHIGVPDAHHPISHHQNQVEKVEKVAKINLYHVTLFAYLLEKLRATADGDGSLLDHVTMMYGAGMADSNRHAPVDLPLILAGGGAGHRKLLTAGIRATRRWPPHLSVDQFGAWDRLVQPGNSTIFASQRHLGPDGVR